jgi:hypothetical protein
MERRKEEQVVKASLVAKKRTRIFAKVPTDYSKHWDRIKSFWLKRSWRRHVAPRRISKSISRRGAIIAV